MKSEAPGEAKEARKMGMHRVAENLYRLEPSGRYYALIKRGDKQFRRALKTKDRKLAERRLNELRPQISNLTLSDDATLGFSDVAKRWMEATQHTLKASSIVRRQTCIKNLLPYFQEVTIRHIETKHCERWLTERASKIAPQTMAHELNVMRGVFDYAARLGLMLKNPAAEIKRKKIVQKPIVIPTREQFKSLIAKIRESDGRLDSQRKAMPGANLVELLAYSGCRIAEATSIRWRDICFERKILKITGGEIGTKNSESRTIPMTSALESLLARMKKASSPKENDLVSPIKAAKRCIQTACRRLNFPQFTHHDFRHFFATTCIEAGVDIPTISRWLGHKDGGALAMRIYGHLRREHSESQALKVTF